ncbi:MAG: hypothetical protein H7Z15_00170, partial [Rhizobacter sp.]|nr:hypothetical protein [Rhizobacter sp.]
QAAAKAGRSPASGAGGAAPWVVTVSDAMGATMDASRLFELGFAGGLVIDKDTRASVEALLNSMPEDLSETDLARLERTLREGLPKEDAEKAYKLITDYRSYTKDIRDEMQPKGIPGNMQEARTFFDQMEAVKRRHFDEATANALFGQADFYARLSMEAMFVQQDTTLTDEQKKAQLDALRAQLPADQKSLIPQDGPPPAASQPAS